MLRLSEAIDMFLAEPFAPGTKRYRLRHLRRFLGYCGNLPIDSIGIAQVAAFRRSLTGSSASVQRETTKTVRALFSWLQRTTDLPCLRPERIALPRVSSTPYAAFSADDVAALRAAIIAHAGDHLTRDLAAFEVMLSTGFRRQELQRITPADVDWQNGSIRVLGKFSRHVRGLLSPTAKNALETHISETTASPHATLFPQSPNWLHERFRTWGQWAGLAKCHPHMLRKTTGTTFYRVTKNIELTRQLLNHENLETTQRYLCLEEQELKDAHAFVFGDGERFTFTTERDGQTVLQADVRCTAAVDVQKAKDAMRAAVDKLLSEQE